MKKKTTLSAAAALALALSAFAGGTANAATISSNDEVVSDFVDGLGLSPTVSQQVEAKFSSLSATDQAAIAAQITKDPGSLLVFGDSVRTVTAQPVASGTTARVAAAAAVTSYKATDTVTGYFLGIPVGSFTTDFKYNASSTKVTSILECKGRFSGFGLTGDSSSSSYISSTGRGTCEITFKMNIVIKDGPFQFNKLHNITTNSGNPKGYKATLS